MAVGDLNLAHTEVGFIRTGNAEVGGTDVDTVRAKFSRKKTFYNDLIEYLSWPYAAITSRVRPSTSSLRWARVMPPPRRRSTAVSSK
jgi:hypothetical protein